MSEKKIGIVTVTDINNFGSHLQSFALQQVLLKLGYDTEIINSKGLKYMIKKKRLIYVIQHFYDIREMKSYFGKAWKTLAKLVDKDFKLIIQKRNEFFKVFAYKAYLFSLDIKKWDDLSDYIKKHYSTVVVGSDQIWRPANIAGGFYTLEFVPSEVNKVAYSSSFGIQHVVSSQKEKAKFFLGRINHISLRENSGCRIVKELIGQDCPVVCDPTILFDKKQWLSFIEDYSQINISEICKDPYILCYFLGTNHTSREFALRLKKETGYRIVSLLYGEGRYYKEKDYFYDESITFAGPLDFVNLISHASFVCTDSFHGCAFSIIFGKQFYAFYKSKSGTKMSVNDRLDTMLGWASLNDRIISNFSDDKDLSMMIDYSMVDENVERIRAFSMQFIKDSLR